MPSLHSSACAPATSGGARVRDRIARLRDHLTTRRGIVDAAFWTLFVAALALMLSPLWLTALPPLTDFGGHAEMAHIWTWIDEPLYGDLFVRNEGWLTTNVLQARFSALLAPWLNAITALKLYLTLGLGATAFGVLFTLRAFDRSRWLALLALPFLWNGMTLLGVINFVMATAMFVWALGLSRRAAVTQRWAPTVGLGVVTIVAYFAHGFGCALVLLGAVAVYLASVQSWRRPRLLLGLTALAPAAALWLSWFVGFVADKPGDVEGEQRFLPPREELDKFLYDSFEPSLIGDWDTNVLLAIGLVLFALLATQRAAPERADVDGHGFAGFALRLRSALRDHTLLVLLMGLSFGFFVVAPTYVGPGGYAISLRLIPLIAFVAVMVPRGPLTHPFARLSMTIGVAAVLTAGVRLTEDVRTWERLEVAPLTELADQIPPGSRVQTLGVAKAMTVFHRLPLNEGADGFVAVRRHGVGHGGFAHTTYNAVRWKQRSDHFRLANANLQDYGAVSRLDYVIVRGTHRAPAEGTAELVANAVAEGPLPEGLEPVTWSLYRINRGAWRATTRLEPPASKGGQPFDWECPRGTALSSLRVTLNRKNTLIAAFTPSCRALTPLPEPAPDDEDLDLDLRDLDPLDLDFQPPGVPGAPLAEPTVGPLRASRRLGREATGARPTRRPPTWRGATVRGPKLGGRGGGRRGVVRCRSDELVVGLDGAAGTYLDQVAFVCEGLDDLGSVQRRPSAPRGGQGGNSYTLSCPTGEVVIGLHGRGKALIDSLGVGCAPASVVRAEGARLLAEQEASADAKAAAARAEAKAAAARAEAKAAAGAKQARAARRRQVVARTAKPVSVKVPRLPPGPVRRASEADATAPDASGDAKAPEGLEGDWPDVEGDSVEGDSVGGESYEGDSVGGDSYEGEDGQ